MKFLDLLWDTTWNPKMLLTFSSTASRTQNRVKKLNFGTRNVRQVWISCRDHEMWMASATSSSGIRFLIVELQFRRCEGRKWETENARWAIPRGNELHFRFRFHQANQTGYMELRRPNSISWSFSISISCNQMGPKGRGEDRNHLIFGSCFFN